MDYNFITSRIATGGEIKGLEDLKILNKAKITHIISCRHLNIEYLLKLMPNFSYLHNPTADDGHKKPKEWFKNSIEFSLCALTIPTSKIYIHCAGGVNRGPSNCYAVLRALGLSSLHAEMLIRIARPQVGLRYKNDADKAIISLGYE
jgi:hypothetical protein